MQRKLTVGPANDPLELEADRVADEVMRVLRSGAGDAAMFASSSSTRIARHAGHHHHRDGGPRPEVGMEGGAISPGLAREISTSSGGRPLPPRTLARMERGFGADFGHVRVHPDSELPARVAADAFTFGSHVHFAPGVYNPSSSTGERLLAHELTHVVQQGHAVARHVCGPGCGHDAELDDELQRSVTTERAIADDITVADSAAEAVRRHSSWEHMLIGDLDPLSLATLGAHEDVDKVGESGTVEIGKTANGTKVVATRQHVLHVIEQEIARLKKFQTNPPRVSKVEQVEAVEATVRQQDPTWNVNLVAINHSSGRNFVVTYGELNTLADYFGSVEEMRRCNPDWLDRLIRGVRHSTMKELLRIYAKMQGFKDDKVWKLRKPWGYWSHDKAAMNLLGGIEERKFVDPTTKEHDAVKLGGIINELKLMGALGIGPLKAGAPKPVVDDKKSTTYGSVLARNACHFAPESWHAWAAYHEEARTCAQQAYNAQQNGEHDRAARLRNEAMLLNGFGDHYLQDSYASGHLINKTLIMQQYVQWLDEHRTEFDAALDKNWRRMQQMAYTQPGLAARQQYDKTQVGKSRTTSSGLVIGSARNPQAAEDVQGSWKDKAEAAGLQVPASVKDPDARKLLVHWWERYQHARLKDSVRTQRYRTLESWMTNVLGIDASKVDPILRQLHADGIIRLASYSVSDRKKTLTFKKDTKFTLRKDYIPKTREKMRKVTDSQTGAAATEDFALGVAYQDYLRFMNSSFIQKATNFVHNEFCVKGLDVTDKQGGAVFKIYGDNRMLDSQSSKGLQHSGETAAMSRKAILDIVSQGTTQISKQQILDRLPAHVIVDGQETALEDWASNRANFDRLFARMSDAGMNFIQNKMVVGVFSRKLGKVSEKRPTGHEIF